MAGISTKVVAKMPSANIVIGNATAMIGQRTSQSFSEAFFLIGALVADIF